MFSRFALTTAMALTLGTAAMAETYEWTAELSQAQETKTMMEAPTAAGTAKGTLDTGTGEMTWQIEYDGLTGSGATASHFHGPAAMGADAGVVVNIADQSNLASPAVGKVKLVQAQMQEVESGLWYINVHTEANPGGEIRGQVIVVK